MHYVLRFIIICYCTMPCVLLAGKYGSSDSDIDVLAELDRVSRTSSEIHTQLTNIHTRLNTDYTSNAVHLWTTFMASLNREIDQYINEIYDNYSEESMYQSVVYDLDKKLDRYALAAGVAAEELPQNKKNDSELELKLTSTADFHAYRKQAYRIATIFARLRNMKHFVHYDNLMQQMQKKNGSVIDRNTVETYRVKANKAVDEAHAAVRHTHTSADSGTNGLYGYIQAVANLSSDQAELISNNHNTAVERIRYVGASGRMYRKLPVTLEHIYLSQKQVSVLRPFL